MNALDGKITMKKLLALARASLLWMLLLPYLMIFTGAASNQAVLIANHDKFPVMVNPVKLGHMVDSPESLSQLLSTGMIDDVHEVMTPKTHLNALADVFDFKDAVYSVGDGLIIGGSELYYPLAIAWLAIILYREKQRLL
jgi:hypothetical protein